MVSDVTVEQPGTWILRMHLYCLNREKIAKDKKDWQTNTSLKNMYDKEITTLLKGLKMYL